MANVGGLSLVDMRAKLKSRVPDLLATYTDGQLDQYLNRAHRYTIPELVPGDMNRAVWEFETVPGPTEYNFNYWVYENYGTAVHSLAGPIFVDDYQINTYRHPERFWYWNRPEDTSQARPSAALILSYGVELRPTPNAAYTFRAPCKLYPAALTDAGLNHGTKAVATVCAAAAELAGDLGLTDLVRELEAEMNHSREGVIARALATTRRRILKRSF